MFNSFIFTFQKSHTGGPRYSRTFYLRIRLFTLGKLVQNDHSLVKNGLLSGNSVFAVQNDRMYLPRITRETCTLCAVIWDLDERNLDTV